MTSKKIAILAAAIAVGSTVRAQDVEPSTETARRSRGVVIEEVLVKAQKRSESIYEVPISISAFSGDTIKDLGLTDTRDLGNLVPGFSYSDSGYSVPIYSLTRRAKPPALRLVFTLMNKASRSPYSLRARILI